MSKLIIVYFSQTGVTHELAIAIKSGALQTPGSAVLTHRISGSEIVEGRFSNSGLMKSILESDAVIFGSPTFMGGPAAQFKAFADATSDCWEKSSWTGKIAAGFTVGSSAGGDQLATLQYFSILAGQHGMVWVGLDHAVEEDIKGINPLGTQLGLAAHVQSLPLKKAELETAEYLGKRVSSLSDRIFKH